MRDWLKHIKGASVLLELRGEPQLKTELGRRLFEHLRMQIMQQCSLTRTGLPQTVIDLSRECLKYDKNPADDLVFITAEFLKLRGERPFTPLSSDPEFVSLDIIHRCTLLAEKLKAWRDHLPANFLPVSVGVSSPDPHVLGNHRDEYSDVWTAFLLNGQRKIGLLVRELAITRLLDLEQKRGLSASDIQRVQELRVAVLDDVREVCASVPFLLRSGRVDAAISVLWPLYVSTQMKPHTVDVGDATRGWMIGQLRKIGNEMGVKQAIYMADLLVQWQEVTEVLTDNPPGQEDESV